MSAGDRRRSSLASPLRRRSTAGGASAFSGGGRRPSAVASWRQLREQQDTQDRDFSEAAERERRRSNRFDEPIEKVRMMMTDAVQELHSVLDTVGKAIDDYNEQEYARVLRHILGIQCDVGRTLRVVEEPVNQSTVDLIEEQLRHSERELDVLGEEVGELRYKLSEAESLIDEMQVRHKFQLHEAECRAEEMFFPPDHAPNPSKGPDSPRCAVAHVEVESEGLLWDGGLIPFSAGVDAVTIYRKALRRELAANRGYEASCDGAAMSFLFPSSFDAVRWAVAAQRALLAADWPQELLASDSDLSPTPPEVEDLAATGDTFKTKAPVENPFRETRGPDGCVIHRGLRAGIGIDFGEVHSVRCAELQLRRRMLYCGPTVQRARAVARLCAGGEILLAGGALQPLMPGGSDPSRKDLFHEIGVHWFHTDARELSGYTSPLCPDAAPDPEVLATVVIPELSHRRELIQIEERNRKVDNMTRAGWWLTKVQVDQRTKDTASGLDGRLRKLADEMGARQADELRKAQEAMKVEVFMLQEQLRSCEEKRSAAEERIKAFLQDRGCAPDTIEAFLCGDIEPTDEAVTRPHPRAVADYLCRLKRFPPANLPKGARREDWKEALKRVDWLGVGEPSAMTPSGRRPTVSGRAPTLRRTSSLQRAAERAASGAGGEGTPATRRLSVSDWGKQYCFPLDAAAAEAPCTPDPQSAKGITSPGIPSSAPQRKASAQSPAPHAYTDRRPSSMVRALRSASVSGRGVRRRRSTVASPTGSPDGSPHGRPSPSFDAGPSELEATIAVMEPTSPSADPDPYVEQINIAAKEKFDRLPVNVRQKAYADAGSVAWRRLSHSQRLAAAVLAGAEDAAQLGGGAGEPPGEASPAEHFPRRTPFSFFCDFYRHAVAADLGDSDASECAAELRMRWDALPDDSEVRVHCAALAAGTAPPPAPTDPSAAPPPARPTVEITEGNVAAWEDTPPPKGTAKKRAPKSGPTSPRRSAARRRQTNQPGGPQGKGPDGAAPAGESDAVSKALDFDADLAPEAAASPRSTTAAAELLEVSADPAVAAQSRLPKGQRPQQARGSQRQPAASPRAWTAPRSASPRVSFQGDPPTELPTPATTLGSPAPPSQGGPAADPASAAEPAAAPSPQPPGAAGPSASGSQASSPRLPTAARPAAHQSPSPLPPAAVGLRRPQPAADPPAASPRQAAPTKVSRRHLGVQVTPAVSDAACGADTSEQLVGALQVLSVDPLPQLPAPALQPPGTPTGEAVRLPGQPVCVLPHSGVPAAWRGRRGRVLRPADEDGASQWVAFSAASGGGVRSVPAAALRPCSLRGVDGPPTRETPTQTPVSCAVADAAAQTAERGASANERAGWTEDQLQKQFQALRESQARVQELTKALDVARQAESDRTQHAATLWSPPAPVAAADVGQLNHSKAADAVCLDASELLGVLLRSAEQLRMQGPCVAFCPPVEVRRIRTAAARSFCAAMVQQQMKPHALRHQGDGSPVDPRVAARDDAALRWVEAAAAAAGEPQGSEQPVHAVVVQRMLRLWRLVFDFAENVAAHLTLAVSAAGRDTGEDSTDAPPAVVALSPAAFAARGVAPEAPGTALRDVLRNGGSVPEVARKHTKTMRGVLGRYQVLTELLDADPAVRERWQQLRDGSLFSGMAVPSHALPKGWRPPLAAPRKGPTPTR
eukprot:TRINITY_DN103_c0_g3_i2.p1 TRINITY_DN103_c0_g3~~TRINITY_DN103_c0_g3_i2.p1  ORF type:complete len:1707 (+),score=515.58 TRINITY_DN103_c0_g3_i2:91-5121(+)